MPNTQIHEYFQDDLSMWRDGYKHFDDLVFNLIKYTAKLGDLSLYQEAQIAIQQAVLDQLQQFKQRGRFELSISKTDIHFDMSGDALTTIALLVDAGILSRDTLEIATPAAFCTGAEHVQQGDWLMSLPHDAGLISAKLLGVSVPPSIDEMTHTGLITIQFEIFRREYQEERIFKLIREHAYVAEIAIRRKYGPNLAELRCSDFIDAITIKPEQFRKRSYLNFQIAFAEKQAEIHCDSLLLQKLVAL